MVTALRKLSLGRITLLGLNGCSGGAELVSNASASIPSTINQAERLLPYLTNSHFVPFAAGRVLEKRSFRNVEMTGAAQLYRAASSDRRERGRSQGYAFRRIGERS